MDRLAIRKCCFVICAGMVAGVFLDASEAFAVDKGGEPSVQVMVCYFHRTVRCPTCKKIGASIEEAVAGGFASEIEEGRVKVKMIDFQDAKNRKFTEAYKIQGPTLVMMKIEEGKVTEWKVCPKVWSLVSDKEKFYEYVEKEIQEYLEGDK